MVVTAGLLHSDGSSQRLPSQRSWVRLLSSGDITLQRTGETLDDHRTLDKSAAVGRYAVAYVRKVCAQAHIGFMETSPGEDVLAVDGLITYQSVDVRVQIKGSTKPSLVVPNGKLRFAIEPKWREKWRLNVNPTYLIYVLMERQVEAWFQYDPTSTTAGAYALWTRIDNMAGDVTEVEFNRSQRFTSATVSTWSEAVLNGYGEVGAGA